MVNRAARSAPRGLLEERGDEGRFRVRIEFNPRPSRAIAARRAFCVDQLVHPINAASEPSSDAAKMVGEHRLARPSLADKGRLLLTVDRDCINNIKPQFGTMLETCLQ